jgi:hypothetical protein
MATDPSELFIVIAQMSVAFAGFGSLASRLGQQHGGDDATVDATRLNLMLFSSLSSTLLGILPATLVALGLPSRLSIQVSAAAAVVGILIYSATGVRRAVSLRRSPGFSRGGVLANIGCTLLAFFAFVSCAVVPGDRLDGAYLLGLVGLLGSSVIMFSRVIISMLRPHNIRA